MQRLSPFALVFLLFACGGEDPGADPSSGAGGSATTTTTGSGAGGEGGEGGSGPAPTLQTIAGDVTWTVTFDETAKANGNTDCSYTRHYEGVQDDSAKWLCPACERMFRTNVAVVTGLDDCYSQVTQTAPATLEWIGYGNGVYYRGFGGPMSDQGTAAVTATAIQVVNEVPSVDVPTGGTLAFDVAGELAISEIEGDPLHGFSVPDSYDCGWPKADPPSYAGDYAIVQGATVPDGIFKDTCGQTVRLHDFAGDYIIIDMSAIDCPPCQQMASEEEAFIQGMAAQGIPVHVITLLAPSLGNPLGETTNAMLSNWTSTFGLSAPVLADRGWGLSMFFPLFGEQTGYPSWVLVDPNLQVIDAGSGFGGYGEHEQAILTHAGM
jgi:hypothetical protein